MREPCLDQATMSSTLAIKRHFASDNYAGICPEAWEYLQKANEGHVRSYGDDRWTSEATDLIRELFETPCEVFFVFNGTAANSLVWLLFASRITELFATRWRMLKRMSAALPNSFPMALKCCWPPARTANSIRRRSNAS